MSRLRDKIGLVTGGSSGIGLATAHAFVREGAQVIITGRDSRTLLEAEAELGGRATSICADHAVRADNVRVSQTILERFGRLDIAFLNAGVGGPASVEDATEEHFDRIFDTNVKGTFFLVQELSRLMGPGGSIVLNSSIAPYGGAPGTSMYSAAKAAVRVFARGFSADLIHRQIRVNAIAPGPIDTPIFARYQKDPADLEKHMERLRSFVPAGRLGLPEEVAEAVVYLASDASAFVIGTELVIDGGASEAPHAAPIYLRS